MTIDLRTIKDYWIPKNIVIGLIALVLLGIFGIAGFSALRPTRATAQDVPTATAPPPTPTATAIPTPLPTAAPSPAPVTVHHVSWTNRETGIYLREAPGNAAILDAIPNGEEITYLGDQTTIRGGLEWIEASYLGQSGWVATEYLFEIEGNYQRVGDDGRWLFRDMNGAIDVYLWFGTPFQVIQAATDKEGMTWQEIRLPDGSTGWMKGQ